MHFIIFFSYKVMCAWVLTLCEVVGGLRATRVNSPFYTAEIKRMYFHLIILKFIMRITETFSLVYAEAGLVIAMGPASSYPLLDSGYPIHDSGYPLRYSSYPLAIS